MSLRTLRRNASRPYPPPAWGGGGRGDRPFHVKMCSGKLTVGREGVAARGGREEDIL
jgi:hypothetical protein